MTTTAQAQRWLDRWDRQQERYLTDREDRFQVIGDVLAAVVQRPDLLVLDLGAGPGSLSVRLLDRFRQAQVIAVDADPLLLGLAQLAYGDRPGLRIVAQDLRAADWPWALELPRQPDAIVSTTALHWLDMAELARLYERCAGLLAPGGVLVNGDHLADAPHRPRLDVLNQAVRASRAARSEAPGEDWAQWWQAVREAPELAGLTVDRPAPISHTVPEVPGLDDHARLLTNAGFAEVGTVWQQGDDRVLVALR